jgi:NAD(P)-dependent dehydrogenase (short-subunit alcohol dehydrogenase family)
MFKGKGPSGFGYGSTAEDVTEGLDLSGRTILLTGCNSGIGKETLRVLAKRGAHVIAAARTVEKSQAACDDVDGETTPVACELSDPASVQACAAQVIALGRPLDAIICNAGIMALPTLNQKFGYELQFFTNHIGHFILVTSLLDSLADKGRVVMVSSDAHNGAPKEGIQFDNLAGEREYSAWSNYGQSKLANLLFANHLAKRLEGSGKTANALHPGVIHTNLARSMNPIARGALALAAPLVLKSTGEGAATQCYLAVHPSVDGVAGKYFSDCNVGKSSSRGRDAEMAAKLWEVSEEIVAEVTA